ncbi:hypothetical protein SAMN05421788_11524 [Filimonas lacunae]|uniref:Uncharacterized protein n=1 Tax=Filimonas lacunae TaxID=477680 RepID=A0A173MC76_9BACT|nr:hypothetical protein [Filimonas lacunae]BAV05136.1 hypothetical protein FLA_1143 [Filimonas lacunae]SIT34172.1 hypothetical protein SAMN05421788_11524 [Filimonas lacunae]
MFIRSLLLGIIAGLLAGVASWLYQKQVYLEATATDFATVVKTSNIFIGSLIGGLLAAVGYWLTIKILKSKGEIVFNLIFVVLSFASILKILSFSLPPTSEDDPALLIGLTVPMHFFPALAWFTLKPLFFPAKAAE